MGSKRTPRPQPRYPQWEFPGLHVKRLTGHGMYAGSFVATWNQDGRF